MGAAPSFLQGRAGVLKTPHLIKLPTEWELDLSIFERRVLSGALNDNIIFIWYFYPMKRNWCEIQLVRWRTACDQKSSLKSQLRWTRNDGFYNRARLFKLQSGSLSRFVLTHKGTYYAADYTYTALNFVR